MWTNSLYVCIEVDVIDDWADISLELNTMQAFRRAATMQHSRTLSWPEPSTYTGPRQIYT